MIERETIEVPISSVVVGARQRRSIPPEHITSLADSIKRLGLICPILIHKDHSTLIAGQCRLEAAKLLGWTTIPAHRAADVSGFEIIALELEENIKRRQLSWTDEARAIAKYHSLQRQIEPEWTGTRTGEFLGISSATVSRAIQVASELDVPDSPVHKAASIRTAYNFIERRQARAIQSELESSHEIFTSTTVQAEIRAANFLESLFDLSGFNFIHCDFPYGISWDTSERQGSSLTVSENTYEDDPKTFDDLLAALVDSWPRLMRPSSHGIFWLPSTFEAHAQVRAKLSAIPGIRIDPVPFVWLKSDNVGIIPDVNRGGRRNYETALFFSTGDRPIVRPANLAYAAPSNRAHRIHISEKPIPVLRHFFQMVVDGSSRILDPTCGSGSAICAAAGLGAEYALGLEINPDFAAGAARALDKYITSDEILDEEYQE